MTWKVALSYQETVFYKSLKEQSIAAQIEDDWLSLDEIPKMGEGVLASQLSLLLSQTKRPKGKTKGKKRLTLV